MAVTITTRNAEGQLVSTPYPGPGDAPTEEAAAAASVTGAQGATPPGPASPEVPSAPPAEPVPPASGEDAGGSEDADLDETATLTPESFTKGVRRINQLTGRLRAEQRRHQETQQAAEQRLAQQQGQIEILMRMLSGAAPDLPQTPPGPPQAEQFTSHEDFVRAVARYEAQDVTRTQQQEATQRTQAQQMQQTLLEREAAFRQAHPDFDQVISTGLRGRIAPHVQQALMVLPEGPAMAYALATQPETLTKLNTMPPALVIAELARMTGPAGSPPVATPTETATNGAAPPAPATPATPLPPPPTPLSGMGQGAPSGATADMSQAEFRRLFNSGWRPSPRDFGR